MSRSRRPQDHWGHRAKREGYAARSVYKLEEIDRRVRLLRPGARVLDLGAYPGSWTAYAAQKVGANGRVLGLDIQEFRGALPPNAEMRTQDVMSPELDAQLGGERFDVVMSDMAPATSGHRFTDQARSFNLVMRALQIAEELLVPGGHFVAKIFQGPDFEEARRAVASAFEEVKIVKPPATRTESIETFLVGLRKRGAARTGATT
ncbi:RlmE family RNA methyltransferase [Sandaracinus amylolyticus]|uniref:Ribosomal RNA large subunit methyltransferase E n=1 Tax=Sandaracinus amylolyticus TaxID=927083 RepID=A0A0F6YJK4_9BACT|nr:RlmE family RNA methyltransferase [Sandaracinus amylolyticus]AKF07120.1 Ribosomal RNA large subunit methyltransferase J [Sandaracinus amylolyticus]